MWHKSIETTLKYYVDQDADDVADELWKAHAGLGNTVLNQLEMESLVRSG